MQVTDEQLQRLLEQAATAAVKEYRRAEEKERKQAIYGDTFRLMRCYRDAKLYAESCGAVVDDKVSYIGCSRSQHFRTLLTLEHIDRALAELKQRREAAGRGIEYEATELYFMQGKTYEDIADELQTGKNTPRRWISKNINELAAMLYGIDGQW